MSIRYLVPLIPFFMLSHASEVDKNIKEKFITVLLYKEGIASEKDERYSRYKEVGGRLFYVWNYHKKNIKNENHIEQCRKTFVTIYLRDLERERNPENIFYITVFFNRMVNNFEETVQKAEKAIAGSPEERKASFNERLEKAGVYWCSKEQEDEFWRGHEEWREWQ